MKKLIFSFAILGSTSLMAQDPAAPAPPAAPPQAPATRADAEATEFLFKRPPEEGSAAAKASDLSTAGRVEAENSKNASDLMSSNEEALDPELEKFLSSEQAPAEQAAQYQELHSKLNQLLAAKRPYDAWQLLHQMNAYEWDAGISKQIANRIEAVWSSSETARAIVLDNQKLRTDIDRSQWNVDVSSSKTSTKATVDPKKGATATTPDASKAVASSIRVTEEYFKAIDAKAKIKLNEVRLENVRSKARADLMDYISTLFKARRYTHTVIVAEFYQVLYPDGDLPREIANQATAASEIRRDIANAAKVFQYKVSLNEIASATAILRKAFALGETTPEMLSLRLEDKQKVIEYARNVRKVQNLLQAREFEQLEKLLDQMEKSCVDFDSIRPRAVIKGVKLDSQMRLGKARILAQQGDGAKAMEEFKAAAAAWPGNPELEKLSAEYFASQDAVNKNSNEFDQLFRTGNYREIAEKQLIFLAAVQNDGARSEQLKQAIKKVIDSDTALTKADIMSKKGDYSGAWETVQQANVQWPDDPKLNRARADLSSNAADFISALSKGDRAREEGMYGYSLACYLNAQRIYPPSEFANAAIEDLAAEILGTKEAVKKPAAADTVEEKADKN